MTCVAGKLLEWERFWAPWDPKAGSGGDTADFLNDPRTPSLNSKSSSLKSTADLANYRCLILLGDPGMGKTTSLVPLMQRIRSSHGHTCSIFEIHCRDVPEMSTFRDQTYGNQRWKGYRDKGSEIVLVVDGVDEGLREIPKFVGALADALKDEPIDQLRVVLACRTSEWDNAAGERLLALWRERHQDCAVFELRRLRWKDALMAAEAYLGERASSFMVAIQRFGLEALAARPLTLRLLMEDYHSRGELASTRRDLYLNAVTRMADEWDESRRRRLKPKVKELPRSHVIAVAKRIAGLLLLCGRSAVSASKDAHQNNDLSIDEVAGEFAVPSGRDPEVVEFVKLSRDDVWEVLNCALFTTRGANRFGFDHPTFGELLAAEFLAGFELRQARRLLCVEFRNREHIIPQLAETAAWLALARSNWAEELLMIDPEVLLRTEVRLLPSDLKRRLVETLLNRASRLETLDHYDLYRRCRGLAYPGLEDQLRPWIEDEKREINAMRVAIKIAGIAPAPKLEPLLWEILDSPEPRQGCSEALSALHDLAGKHSRKNLQRIFDGHIRLGPNFEALALAIHAGVPAAWPVRAVLSWLREPAEDWIGGEYRTILDHHLPGAMTQSDIVPVMNKLRDWPGCFDGLSPFSGLAYCALSMALESPQTPAIERAVASMWAYRVEKHWSLPRTKFTEWEVQFSHRQDEQTLREQAPRRYLASILIEAPGFRTDQIWTYEPQLLEVGDLGWALEKTKTARRKYRKQWAAAALGLVTQAARLEAEKPESKELTGHDRDVNAVLRLQGVEAFIGDARILPAAGLTVTCVRREKAQILKWQRRSKRRKFHSPTVEERLKEWLEGYRQQGGASFWAHIGTALYFHRDWRWGSMTEADIKTAKDCAREFLLSYNDAGRPPDRFNDISIAAYEAIHLLRTNVSRDLILKRAVTDKWMFALHDTLENDRNRHRDAIAWAYRLAPNRMIAALVRRLRHYDQPDGYDHATPNFGSCWDARLTRTVQSFLLTARNGSIVESCIENMINVDRPAAEKWLKKQLNGIRRLGVKRDRSNGIVVSVLNSLDGADWDRAWNVLHRSPADSRRTYLYRLASPRVGGRDYKLDGRSASQLGQLFQEISVLLRSGSEGDYSDDEGEANANEGDQGGNAKSVSNTRRGLSVSDTSILHSTIARKLAESGTEEALMELERLQGEVPGEFMLLAYYLKDCVRKRLSVLASERAPASGDILKLYKSAAQWVESERDLFEVVQASVRRFQSELTAGSHLAAEYLWNKDAPKDEDIFSKMLAGWLAKDLLGIIVNRETQVESVGGGRLDIKIQAVPRSGLTGDIATTVIEVKRCSHAKVRSALQSQLIDGYMKRENIRYGVHLVAWFGHKSARDARWVTLEDAQSGADVWIQQSSLPAGFCASCVVVDCRRTAVVPSRLG